MKIPKKYTKTNPGAMKREIKKNKDKADNDPSAYTEWDADYKSGKAGKGKKVATKTSQYTKKYKKMFGENENSKILGFDSFVEAVEVAGALSEICKKLKINLVFKSSYDKANRTSNSGNEWLSHQRIWIRCGAGSCIYFC